jgi:hypothetical protein
MSPDDQARWLNDAADRWPRLVAGRRVDRLSGRCPVITDHNDDRQSPDSEQRDDGHPGSGGLQRLISTKLARCA